MKNVNEQYVYQKLCQLHVEVSACTIQWSKQDKQELGKLLRESTNLAAEVFYRNWGGRNFQRFKKGLQSSLFQIRRILHFLYIASLKNYLATEQYTALLEKYKECKLLLKNMETDIEEIMKNKILLIN